MAHTLMQVRCDPNGDLPQRAASHTNTHRHIIIYPYRYRYRHRHRYLIVPICIG